MTLKSTAQVYRVARHERLASRGIEPGPWSAGLQITAVGSNFVIIACGHG